MTNDELDFIIKAVKPKPKTKPPPKSRCFCFLLYPEDNSQMDILDYIGQNYEYAFILHNQDKWENDVIDNETGEIIYKKGDFKKPHYHVIICFKNARYLKKVQEDLGLSHIETCNFYAYCRYLIHLDEKDKFKYSPSEIITNIQARVDNALKREYNSREEDTRFLLDYIKSFNGNYVTFRMLTDYALEHDCILELKRNVYFYRQFTDDFGFRRY